MGTSWGIAWHNNSINYLDFLRAVENNKLTRPQSQEKEESVPINFAALSPEEVLKNIQGVIAASSLALSTVRQATRAFTEGTEALAPCQLLNTTSQTGPSSWAPPPPSTLLGHQNPMVGRHQTVCVSTCVCPFLLHAKLP